MAPTLNTELNLGDDSIPAFRQVRTQHRQSCKLVIVGPPSHRSLFTIARINLMSEYNKHTMENVIEIQLINVFFHSDCNKMSVSNKNIRLSQPRETLILASLCSF